MMRRSRTSRVIAFVLALALVVTTAFSTNVTTANAASGKAIKSVTLKINKKKVNNKTYTLAKGKSATVKVTVKPASAKKSVTYKSSKKSVATVSKKGKVTAKAAGSAKITVTVKGKNGKKKSAKFTVKVTGGSSSSNGTTAVQATTTAVQATTTAAQATAETPATPKQSYTVKAISAINPSTGEVVLTFDKAVGADELKGTTITITSEDGTKVDATFKEISAEGKDATYVIATDDLSKIATGSYTITTDISGVTIPEDVAATSAKVQITGSSVKGLVYYKNQGEIVPVEKASVTIEGKSAKSDSNGYYETAVNAGNYSLITVKADGFFDANKTDVKVVNNKASAYNFELEKYDIDQVYLYGTVTDKDDSSSVVAGASVTLYEDDVVKAEVTTDTKGRFAFLNESAELPTTYTIESGSKVTFADTDRISKEHTYKIVVNKGIETDLFGAWKEATSGAIDLGSAKNVNVGISMTKVEAIGDIKLSLKWDDKADKAKGQQVSLTLMDTDGEREIKSGTIDLADYLNDTNSGMTNGYKLVDENFFGSGSNAHPTLPTGTYYLVIKDLDENGEQQNATAVVAVDVKEGEGSTASTTIESGLDRTISYPVSLSDAYKKKTLAEQTTFTDTETKKALKNVMDNEGTKLGDDIAIDTGVYQIVGGTPVLIDTISGTKLTAYKPNDGNAPAFGATATAGNLSSDKNYQLVTKKSYLTSAAKSFSTADGEETIWTVSFSGAANVVNVKADKMERFVDKQQDDGNAEDETVTVNAVTVTPESGTAITVSVDKKYKLSDLVETGVSIDDEALKGITPGKYTVTFDIEGFALSTSADEQDEAEDVIDLQQASMVSSAKYNKVYPTTVKGVISYASSVDTTKKTLDANGIAILYSSDKKKILAADSWKKVDEQITYSLEDGIDGTFGAGEYIVLIRGEGIDNQTKTVTITSENQVVSNANFTELSVGGSSYINSSITTKQNATLGSNPSVVAKDQYYIDPWSDDVDDLAFATLWNSKYNGSYELTLVTGTTTTWGVNGISDGTYDVTVKSDDTVEGTFKFTLNKSYRESMTVDVQSYEDLVKIQLSLTNENATYKDGQIDYIVATTADGTVSKDRVFIRGSKSSDIGYFYVPRGQLYTISIYSNDTIVKVEERATQATENEKISVICQTIE